MASSRITVNPSALPDLMVMFRMCGVFIDGTAESSGGVMELKISGAIVPDLPHVTGEVSYDQTPEGWVIRVKFIGD